MQKQINRRELRELRKMRFWRRRISLIDKPRLCVFRSSKHMQVQLIDDVKQAVLASASTIESDLRKTKLSGKEAAKKVGALVAQRAIKAGVQEVVFDRNGFMYHGRVQALADAAREAGLKF